MTWLQTLLEFLRQFIPWQVVRDGEAGVRFVFGRSRGPYKPGWYASVPMLFEMHRTFIAHRVFNMLPVSVTTADGVALVISANVTYMTHDARLALTAVLEPESALAQEAMKALHRVCRRVTRQTLLEQQRKLEANCKRQLQRHATNWGLTIVDVGLTDLVRSSQHRLFTDAQLSR